MKTAQLALGCRLEVLSSAPAAVDAWYSGCHKLPCQHRAPPRCVGDPILPHPDKAQAAKLLLQLRQRHRRSANPQEASGGHSHMAHLRVPHCFGMLSAHCACEVWSAAHGLRLPPRSCGLKGGFCEQVEGSQATHQSQMRPQQFRCWYQCLACREGPAPRRGPYHLRPHGRE